MFIKKQQKGKKQTMKLIRKIITHFQPHLDEYLAMFIFQLFGWNRAHFIQDLEYGYIATTEVEGNLIKDNPDHLFLGVGGGAFDDHGKQDGKSCSQLVCRFLGVYDDLRLRLLVKRVTIFDKHGGTSQNRYTLPESIKLMHQSGLPDKEVREWTMKALWAIFESEAELYDRIRIEVCQTIKAPEARDPEIMARFQSVERSWYHLSIHKIAELIGGQDGKEWLNVALDVFNRQDSLFKTAITVAKRHRIRFQTKFGPRTFLVIDGSAGEYADFETFFDKTSRHAEVKSDLVFLRNTQGNTFIGVNPSAGFNLEEFVGLLRKVEAQKQGKQIPDKFLRKEGGVKEQPQWFVHEGINFVRIYNGTHTRPFANPTELSFEEIQNLLESWLEVQPISEEQFLEVSVVSAFLQSQTNNSKKKQKHAVDAG